MELTEAIKQAIDVERRVRDHYAAGAEAIRDPSGKRVFEVLSQEEQGHLDYLEHLLADWQRTGVLTVTEITRLVSSEIPEALPPRSDVATLTNQTELDLVKTALHLEQQTAAFYQQLVEVLEPTGQELFRRFLEIEDGHVMVVQAQLNALQGLGYWFDFAEFSLEAQ